MLNNYTEIIRNHFKSEATAIAHTGNKRDKPEDAPEESRRKRGEKRKKFTKEFFSLVLVGPTHGTYNPNRQKRR